MFEVFSKYYNYFFLLIIPIYNLFSSKLRPLILLIISFLFYYLINSNLTICLIITIISVYLASSYLDKLSDEEMLALEENKENKKDIKQKFLKKRRIILIITILINFSLLFVFKYLKFFTVNTNILLKVFHINYEFKILKFLAPLGISFYTLQALSYLFDVYNKKIKSERSLVKVALFISFLPQLTEGPIARFSNTADDLYKGHKVTYDNFCLGMQRIFWGLFKKMIIADRLNILVKTVFQNYNVLNGCTIFIGSLAYTIMLYMDFSGIIDVVIGIGEMFKVKIPENFKQPFFSKSISEFWSRWHISLGSWLKDYIYYPISLSKPMKKLTIKLKKTLNNHYGPLVSGTFALFIVWLLNGLWHGAGWTFLLFGMYHFILISLGNLIHPILNKFYNKLNISNSKILSFLKIIKVSFLVIIGELIFRAETVSKAFFMIAKIFTSFKFSLKEVSSLGLDFPDFFILIIALLIVLIVSILKEKNINIREKIKEKPIVIRWIIYYLLIFAIIIFGAFGPGYEPVDPMYADF